MKATASSEAKAWPRSARWRDLAGWQRRPWHLGRGDNHFSDRSPDRYELTDPAEYLAVNAERFVLDAEFACRRPAVAQVGRGHAVAPQGVQRQVVALAWQVHTQVLPEVDELQRAANLVALAQGLGILQRSEWHVAPYLRSGRLQTVLPGWQMPGADIHAVYPARKNLSAKVVATITRMITPNNSRLARRT